MEIGTHLLFDAFAPRVSSIRKKNALNQNGIRRVNTLIQISRHRVVFKLRLSTQKCTNFY